MATKKTKLTKKQQEELERQQRLKSGGQSIAQKTRQILNQSGNRDYAGYAAQAGVKNPNVRDSIQVKTTSIINKLNAEDEYYRKLREELDRQHAARNAQIATRNVSTISSRRDARAGLENSINSAAARRTKPSATGDFLQSASTSARLKATSGMSGIQSILGRDLNSGRRTTGTGAGTGTTAGASAAAGRRNSGSSIDLQSTMGRNLSGGTTTQKSVGTTTQKPVATGSAGTVAGRRTSGAKSAEEELRDLMAKDLTSMSGGKSYMEASMNRQLATPGSPAQQAAARLQQRQGLSKTVQENQQRADQRLQQTWDQLTPQEQYAMVPEAAKNSWMKPGKSNMTQLLLSYQNAQKNIEANPILRAEVEKTIESLEKDISAHNGVISDLNGQRGNKEEKLQKMKSSFIRNKGLIYSGILERPDNYNDFQDDFDRELYDAYAGKGEYDKIMRTGNKNDKERLFADLRDMWADVDSGRVAEVYNLSRDIRSESGNEDYSLQQLNYEQKLLEQKRNELKSVDEYERHMDAYSQIPEKESDRAAIQDPVTYRLQGKNPLYGLDDIGTHNETVHQIYSFLTGGNEYRNWVTAQGTENFPVERDAYRGAMLMNPKEKEIFIGWYEAGEYDKANAFLDGLSYAFNQRYAPYEEIKLRESARMNPVGTSVVGQVTGLVNGLLTVPRLVAGALGDKSAYDPNSKWYEISRYNEITEDEVAKNIGGFGGKVYSVAMNTMRNVARALLTKGAGTALSSLGMADSIANSAQATLSMMNFGSQVMQDATYKHLKNNDYVKANLLALVDTLLEVGEEFLPFEAMLGDTSNPFSYVMKNALSEFGQEFTGATIGDRLQALLPGTEDEINDRTAEILRDGGYEEDGKFMPILTQDKGKALAQASAQAWREWIGGAVEQGLAGLAGGGLGATYGAMDYARTTYNAGRTVQSADNTVNGKTGLQRLIDAGKASQDKRTKALAEALEKRSAKSGKANNFAVGQLVGRIAETASGKYREAVGGVASRVVQQQLVENGVSAENAGEMSSIIVKGLMGEKLNKVDVQTLSKEEGAVQLFRSYNAATTPEDVAIRSAMQQDLRTGISENAQAREQESVMDTLEDLQTKVGRATSAMAADVRDAVKFGKGNTAAAVDRLAERRADLISERYAAVMKKNLSKDDAKNDKTYIDDAVKIRLAAMSLAKALPKTRLSNETAQELFDEAKEEFDEADAGRVLKQKPFTPEEIGATINGAKYGTDAWKAEAAKAGLNKRQRNMAGAIGEIAARAGLKINLVNDEKNSNIFGMEEQDGSITLNMAGKEANGSTHHMLTTLSHEFTHWLEQNSWTGYNNLRQYIVDELRNKGTNVEGLLVHTVDNQRYQLSGKDEQLAGNSGASLDMNGAMAELVAKSCENLLSSETMIQKLSDTNPTLFSQAYQFVKNFTARIREAVKGMDLSASYEARMLYKETENIAQLWSKAWDEARGRNPEEGAEQTGETSFSISPEIKGNSEEAGRQRFSVQQQNLTQAAEELQAEENAIRQETDAAARTERAAGYMKRVLNWQLQQNRNEQEGYVYSNGMIFKESFDPNSKKDMKRLSELKDEEARLQDAIERYDHLEAGSEEEQFISNWLEMKETHVPNVHRQLREKAENMLLRRIEASGGIPYKAPEFYDSYNHRWTANLIKQKEPVALATAAWEMAQMVPSNAVLIPMPNHNGVVDEDTDTLALAQSISRITGSPVVNALAGVAREKRQDTKTKERSKQLTAKDMGFRQVAEIPEGTIPYFVDNLIASGETAKAAHDAFGRGVTIAYAKTTRGAIDGLKRADLTTYDKGKYGQNLIPLDERANMEKTGFNGTKYSTAQQDREYLDAVNSGDTETAQRMVDEAAKKAFPNSKLIQDGEFIKMWHHSNSEFNEFLPGTSNGPGRIKGIYFTNNEHGAISSAGRKYHKQYYLNVENPKMAFGVKEHAKYVDDLRKRQEGVTDRKEIERINREFSDETGIDAFLDWQNGWYTMLKPENIKSADPVTYDDNGNVIPLSERFNTGNADTRYSTAQLRNIAELDERYMDAYNSYDDEEGEKIIAQMAEFAMPDSKVRDENGKLKVVYHQTNADPFTVFDMSKARQTSDFVGAFFAPEYDEYHEYGDRTYPVFLDIKNPAYDPEGPDLSKIGDGKRRTDELIAQGYDGIINTENGKPYEYIAFYPDQIKSAEAFTEDDDGDLIHLIQRFDRIGENKNDIRYSVQQNELRNDDGELLAEELPGGAITKYSLRSWEATDVKELTKQLIQKGFEEKDVKKWIKDVNGIAAMIAGSRDLLDYEASPYFTMLKNNQEYVKTLDASTLCAKRLLYQGIFNEIQHMLPNTPILPEDLIKLVNMMKKRGLTTPCGICYVESRRRMLGKYASEWLKEYKGEYVPKLAEVTTTDGLERLREEHPQTYQDFVDAMNAKGSANPKVVQLRTDYRGEIRNMTENQIRKVKEIGGLRVQSFSDFEMVHMIDMMQAVLDMAAMDLTSQAYTKVPAFAWIFGDTGIKINLSLIGEGKGVDENGNLIFSSTEGMDFDEAMAIRKKYSKNVGTILVGMNDEHVIAAMGDSRIDFIIPFHKSGWGKKEMARVTGMSVYKDYTRWQNEKQIAEITADGKVKTIPNKKSKLRNLEPVGPNGYWDFSKSGTENAEEYLRLCKADGRVPKFHNFLEYDGEGGYRLPTDGSQRSQNIRNGYWKLLIDFKMYDNEGNGSPQTEVKANFNMSKARELMEDYRKEVAANGITANVLPTDHDVARQFVKEYKNEHTGRTRFSTDDTVNMDVKQFMLGMNEQSFKTAQERTMWRQFKETYTGLDVARLAEAENLKKIREINRKEAEGEATPFDRQERITAQNRLDNWRNKRERLEKQLIEATNGEGYAAMMFRQTKLMNDLVNGRSTEDVRATVEALTKQLDAMTREIEKREKEIAEMRSGLAQRKQSTLVNEQSAGIVADYILKEYATQIPKKDMIRELVNIRLKMAGGQDVSEDLENLAWEIAAKSKGEGSAYLDMLRGHTILLGKGQMAELKARNISLNDIRKELTGTGIKIREAKVNEAGLDNDWGELCDMIPSLNRDTGEKDQLDELLGVIRSEKQNLTAGSQFEGHIDEVVNDLAASAATISMHVPNDPEAMAILKKMDAIVNEMAAGITKSVSKLKETRAQVLELIRSGRLAMSQAQGLQNDLDKMIQYNNALSEQSEAVRWKNEKHALVEQLKAENTQNLLKEQEKWKARIARDAEIRQGMESNRQLRRQIMTNVERIRKLLLNETDLKNIPEHMKSLAREMLGIILKNDVYGGRKITGYDPADMIEYVNTLQAMEALDGKFTIDDLMNIRDDEARSVVEEALADIEEGIAFYNAKATGNSMLANVNGLHNALVRISEAVAAITGIINAERTISFMDRKESVMIAANRVINDLGKSRFKGEIRGRGSKAINTAKRSVWYGNMTPVYFIKNLRNQGMSELWQDIEKRENRNGLEIKKAQNFVRGLAERTHYRDWADQKITVNLSGKQVTMTVGNAMEILAIWTREHTDNPEMSSHMEKGGIYIQEHDEAEGKFRREKDNKRPMRIHDNDIARIEAALSHEQKEFMFRLVSYLSNEMSELGNEASMQMYGIKKYKEKFYFPMKIWDGVRSARSDTGISGTNENRAAHKSWSKRRQNRASNPLVIGDFVEDAVRHIVEMINYNTMAPAVENLNKVLNYQQTEYDADGEESKRNTRIMFQDAYGKDALNYLETFMKDMNGGVAQDQRKSLRDRMLSIFRKNAVAGSLSVTAQQPLSFIRAAMMLNPVDMARALNPTYWKGSYREMMAHSGVAVIKDMGRFDMNFGKSAQDYVAPEKKQTVASRVSDALTVAPELADRATWTRIWSACKIEQHRLHPEMDISSEEFLKLVAERFNDIVRKTQVYDSILVKSSNMRSQNLGMKVLTSFMAEPTLSLNVLEDAVRNAREKGGKQMLARAVGTFLLSAALQAAVKAAIGSGRSPDDKKTWEENFWYKFQSTFMGEANPASLIPGYSDLIEVLKTGELADDAMGALGKIKSVLDTGRKAITGDGKGWYRDLEDTAGQIAQLFTNIPAKNLMRDLRAMLTWFGAGEAVGAKGYAKRPTSGAVLRNQARDLIYTGDNMLGVLNTMLGDAGFRTTNAAYYQRIYEARKNGNDAAADSMTEYLELGKGVSEKTISSGVAKAAREDQSAGAEDTARFLIEEGADAETYIRDQMKAGEIGAAEARKLLAEANPEKGADSIWWTVDRIEYQMQTGEDVSGTYYRLWDAMDDNRAEEIKAAVKLMTEHGVEEKSIRSQITGKYKEKYLNADSKEKIKIRDSIQKAYKALGKTAADADKVINAWK